jgi:ABC-type amino acid transport system permease subunit
LLEDIAMQFVRVVPLLLIMLVAFLLGLVAWGFWRTRGEEINDMPMTPRDDVLLGFLMLAAVALVIFMAYALLGLH